MKVLQNMKYWRLDAAICPAILVAVALLAAQPAFTFAGEVHSDEGKRASKIECGVSRSSCCCPNDYVCKPTPSVCAVGNCCPDTYCPKPCLALPCPANCCCPDDYCPKPLPSLCRPISNAWYKCVASPPCIWGRQPVPCVGQKD